MRWLSTLQDVLLTVGLTSSLSFVEEGTGSPKKLWMPNP